MVVISLLHLLCDGLHCHWLTALLTPLVALHPASFVVRTSTHIAKQIINMMCHKPLWQPHDAKMIVTEDQASIHLCNFKYCAVCLRIWTFETAPTRNYFTTSPVHRSNSNPTAAVVLTTDRLLFDPCNIKSQRLLVLWRVRGKEIPEVKVIGCGQPILTDAFSDWLKTG